MLIYKEFKMVPTKRIELLASPLPRECSTPELRGQNETLLIIIF